MRPTHPSTTLVLDLARSEGAKTERRCQMILETIQTVSAVESRLVGELAQAGLSSAGFSVMSAIRAAAPEPMPRVDLSEQTELSGSVLDDTLSRLEFSDLVERLRKSGRSVSFRLTPAGQERINNALRQYVAGVIHATQFLDESTVQACLENAQTLRRGTSAFEA